MVDFSVSEEMQLVLKTLKRFIQTELVPHEAEVEEKQFVRPELARELRGKAKALGLFAPGMPAESGGGGLSAVDMCLCEIKADPQVIQNECLMQIPVRGGAATVLAHPVRYDGVAPGLRRMPVDLGTDTRAVLRDVGFSDDAIADLVSSEVILDPALA